jgi:hypothetical protein
MARSVASIGEILYHILYQTVFNTMIDSPVIPTKHQKTQNIDLNTNKNISS